MSKEKLTKEWLYDQYIIQNKTQQQIAEYINSNQSNIYYLLNKFNIKKENYLLKQLENREWLYDQYVIQDKSLQFIAKELKTNWLTIQKFTKLYNLVKINPADKYLTKEWLYDQYIIQNKTKEQISRELKIDHRKVIKKLKEFNIEKTFKIHNIEKEHLIEEYINRQKSPSQISKELKISHSVICRRLNEYNIPIRYNNFSSYEIELNTFLKNNNIESLQNERRSIYPYELDLYLPKFNLAIEFNGLYWHSYNPYDKIVNFKYENSKNHLSKTLICESKGIQLLHIFEDEWIEKKEIWKSIILAKCGIFKERIYARKCIIKEINNNEARLFLETNHLQESRYGTHIGLIHNDELIALITYGKSRFKQGEMELYRFATKLNTQVIGGFSKLIKSINIPMVTYADRRYSNGKMYSKIGEFVGLSDPNYWYIKNKVKLSRYQCMKHKLPKLLGEQFDPNLTEKENMFRNGYRVLYDCGNLKFELNKEISV